MDPKEIPEIKSLYSDEELATERKRVVDSVLANPNDLTDLIDFINSLKRSFGGKFITEEMLHTQIIQTLDDVVHKLKEAGHLEESEDNGVLSQIEDVLAEALVYAKSNGKTELADKVRQIEERGALAA